MKEFGIKAKAFFKKWGWALIVGAVFVGVLLAFVLSGGKLSMWKTFQRYREKMTAIDRKKDDDLADLHRSYDENVISLERERQAKLEKIKEEQGEKLERFREEKEDEYEKLRDDPDALVSALNEYLGHGSGSGDTE
jgi:deoxyribodipyrimidine photolyase